MYLFTDSANLCEIFLLLKNSRLSYEYCSFIWNWWNRFFTCCLQKSVLKAEVVDWIVVGSESSLCDNYTVYCLSWGDRLICCQRSERCKKHVVASISFYKKKWQSLDNRWLGQVEIQMCSSNLLTSVRRHFHFILDFFLNLVFHCNDTECKFFLLKPHKKKRKKYRK